MQTNYRHGLLVDWRIGGLQRSPRTRKIEFTIPTSRPRELLRQCHNDADPSLTRISQHMICFLRRCMVSYSLCPDARHIASPTSGTLHAPSHYEFVPRIRFVKSSLVPGTCDFVRSGSFLSRSPTLFDLRLSWRTPRLATLVGPPQRNGCTA
jgi:hypothetical protein